MKLSKLLFSEKPLLRNLIFSICLFPALLWSNTENTPETPSALFSNLTGNIWVETDGNATYNGESGPSGVRVFLYDNEEDTIISQSTTIAGKYEFNGVPAGKYYLRIDQSAFQFGGPLFDHRSCIGTNDANDMVDDDDNGTDTAPEDVLCSSFNLTNSDPMSNVSIEYIDFCFFTSCDELNPLAETACENILPTDIICDINGLDNLCSIMPADSSAGNQPSPLCDGFNSSENISWFAFAASDGNYSLNITPMDCTVGNIGQQGIQVGIYTDCTFSETVFCSNICTTNSISIASSLLNPGQIYYLYINGCNGNVCSYQMDIIGSPTQPLLEPQDVCIFSGGAFQCEDISYCPNDDIIFQGQGLTLSADFTWSITTISGDQYLGDSIVNTDENNLVINIPTEGKYNICLTEVKNGCPDQGWNGVVCREVSTSFSVPMVEDEDFGEFFVCENLFDEFSINEFASEDPNGDGDSGWNASIPDYMLGLNEATVSTEGCSYDQQFTLTNLPPTPTEDVYIAVCEEDLPIQVDILSITIFNFSGSQIFELQDYLLQNSKDQNGCDSTINLTIEKLNILQGSILDPICTGNGIFLEFDYIDDLSTESAFLNFEWLDPSGNVLPNGANPQTVTAPFSSGNGEYTLTVTIDKNGTICNYTYSTNVFISDFLPLDPIINGPTTVCDGDVSDYTAIVQGDETMFIWSYPNDVASANISGAIGEILTIDWTGSNGGDVAVIAQNTCGQSEQVSFEVEVISPAIPDFNLNPSTCIDDPTTIDFIGSNLNIVDYIWDFDGGIVVSGTDMGPYEVFWDTSGDKLVSLFTTDIYGCNSLITTNLIGVQEPLEATAVTCTATLGEVTFMWEIPLMVSGFEVNVLTGQTGGIFTATSFTVGGLSEGEVVTIELLTIPEDQTCGEYVSSIYSCVGQSCTPPEIELSADQSICADADHITIDATITTGETGTGIFEGPGIIDALAGIFDPGEANLGTNTILYTFTSDLANCVGSKTISIEVFDIPTSSFTQDLDTMCITEMVNLDYTGTANVDVYDWDYEDGVGSGLLTNQEVIFDSPGLKTITLQVSKDGCVSTQFSSTIFVEPELDNLEIQCDTAATDFLVFSWNAINGVSLYQISIDGGAPFFTPNTTITIDELDPEQTVQLTVSALSNTSCPGVVSDEICTTLEPVSVDNPWLSEISVFPNPVQNLLFLDGIKNRNLSYDLYSIIGKSVKRGRANSEAIDISNIPTGIYILRLTESTTNRSIDFKVLKE